MTEVYEPTWAERAADRSPLVQRSRSRGMENARLIVDAARRLIPEKGGAFTTQELVREAGVALQTFYRYFAGKDQLLLAVVEDVVAEGCAGFAREAASIEGPLQRLEFFIVVATNAFLTVPDGDPAPRFITSEHWRLQRLFPAEVAEATRPFTNLLVPELRAAAEAGLIPHGDADYNAWLITQLVMAVYHHYAYTPDAYSPEDVSDRLWRFCSSAIGVGSATGPAPADRPA